MPKPQSLVYDTRFFVEHFYSSDQDILNLTRKEIDSIESEKLVSVIAIHEFYRLNLERAGRDAARIRTGMIQDAFEVVDVNKEIALEAAELRKRHAVPMGDGLIAATTKILGGICVTDDPHIKAMKEIKSRWIL
ncbi:MAG: PIN domain-containing protein [Nitrososphaerales archaeon]